MAGETVLIVEDRRENIVHLANNVLKPNGYQVITAMDGQRGLKRILADRPDLVVMDLNMPKMDGLEVLAALQERQVDVPVILTTFYGSEHVAEQALRLGAVEYVVKPYEIGDMLAAVQRALSDRPPAPRPAEPEEVMPLTRQVERWMRDMNILTRVGKALVAQIDLERICVRTIEAAIYITRADYAFLFLTGEDDDEALTLCAYRGPTDKQVHLLHRPAESRLARQVLRSRRTLRQSRGQGDAALFEVAGQPLGPLAATPLRWRKTSYGVLLAARDRGEAAFGEPDAEWLSGLAEYVAIAVSNARLAEQCAEPPPAALDAEAVAALRHDLGQLAEGLGEAQDAVQRLLDRLSPPLSETD